MDRTAVHAMLDRFFKEFQEDPVFDSRIFWGQSKIYMPARELPVRVVVSASEFPGIRTIDFFARHAVL